MKDRDENLALKKLTLQAWAKLILKEGLINIEKYNKMCDNIEKIKS